ncbi:MAG: hypothetical protein QXT81_00250 [Candidatus Bathyarchaeia archaeon]
MSETLLNIMGALTVVNTVLVALIMYNFVQSYKAVKSRFTLGLLLFSSILLVQVVFSLPVIVLSGIAYPPEALIFDIIAGSFEFVALLIFLRMTIK